MQNKKARSKGSYQNLAESLENKNSINPNFGSWKNDEENIHNGDCSFPVDYLGCVEVNVLELRNSKFCHSYFEKLIVEQDQRILNVIPSILWVTEYELRLVESQSKNLIFAHIIGDIYFCSSVAENPNRFFYTCKDSRSDKWYCHFFLANEGCSGDRLCRAVGISFRECLRRKILRENLPAANRANRCIG
ncbi:protein numb homolog isoform X2 [Daktulosphaira vitifoliae]|nr:protein numb homolog isoform X2 [Daktulosphaira vitifoliae]